MSYIDYYTIFLKNMKAQSFLKIRKDKSLFFIDVYVVVNLGDSADVCNIFN